MAVAHGAASGVHWLGSGVAPSPERYNLHDTHEATASTIEDTEQLKQMQGKYLNSHLIQV